MITAYWRPHGHIVEGGLDCLRSKGTVWVDCFNPTPQELLDISAVTGIEMPELRERLIDYERPTTIESEKCSLIIFGVPVIREDRTEVSSLAIFLLKNKNMITLRTDELDSINNFRKQLLEKNPKYFDSLTRTVQVLIEKVIDVYFDHMDRFHDLADQIEQNVIANPKKTEMEGIFKIRTSLVFFHKALIANREVILSIEKAHLKKISQKEVKVFREMYEDVMQLIDTCDTLRSILTEIMDIYSSASANLMNEAIKKLTVVASYVLIPTLIASIYGMNFVHLPEIAWKYGYAFALGLMAFSIVVVYYYFKRSNLL